MEGMENMNLEFWKGKKVFITGHTGFKGGWLTLWLQSLGAEVTGLSLQEKSGPSFFKAVNLQEVCEHITGDIRDFEFLKSVLNKTRPDIVLHLAAQSLVRKSYINPVETYSTNVLGTVNLLEAIRFCQSVKSCLIVTSDKCYENNEWAWGYRENDKLGGFDPYSSSKSCSELVASAYFKSFFKEEGRVGIATARSGNVIGGGDFSEERLIPDFFRAFESNKELHIRYPNSIRPWQHVLVPLSGYLSLAENIYIDNDKYFKSYNFGPNESDCIEVNKILEKFLSFWDQKISIIYDENNNFHEAQFLKLDISKARLDLKWVPKWNLEKTIEETIIWYRAYLDGKNMRKLTLDQIHRFNL